MTTLTSSASSPSSSSSSLYFWFRKNQKVPVTFGSHISMEEAQQAIQSDPFRTWVQRCERQTIPVGDDNDNDDSNNNNKDRRQYQQLEVHSVELQSIDMFGPRRVGFLKIKSHVTLSTWVWQNDADGSQEGGQFVRFHRPGEEEDNNNHNKPLPGICFLRGSAVTILVALFCTPNDDDNKNNNGDNNNNKEEEEEEPYTVLVEQARIPIGQVACLELPAGMVDDDTATISGIVMQELEEECGIVVDPKSSAGLVDLTELAFGNKDDGDSDGRSDPNHNTATTAASKTSTTCCNLPGIGIPPSPGGCDEMVRLFYLEKSISQQQLQDMKGRLHGLRDHGEYITLRVVPLSQAWKVSGDAKVMMSLFLVDQLRKEGKLPKAGDLATPLTSASSK